MKFEEAIKQLSEEALKKLTNCADVNEAIKVFTDNGIDISIEDIKESMSMSNRELSDDELASVTGGSMFALPELFQFIIRKSFGRIKDEFNKNIL